MGRAGKADTSVARRIDNPSYLRTRRRKSGLVPALCTASLPGGAERGFRELLAPGYYACSSARPRGTAPRDPPRPPKAPKSRPTAKPAKPAKTKKPAETGMPHDAWKPAKPPRPAKDGQKSGQNRLKSAKMGHGQRAPHRHGPRPGPRRAAWNGPSPGPPESRAHRGRRAPTRGTRRNRRHDSRRRGPGE